MVSGRPGLRSVDSESDGPRDPAPKDSDEEADAVFRAEGNTATPLRQAPRLLRGPRAWHADMGSPGTWEICARPRVEVPRNEGNEVKRDARTEVGIAHGTDEAGEPKPWDSVEGRGDQFAEPEKRKMSETLRSGSVTTKLQRIAELAKMDPVRVFSSVAQAIDLEWMEEAYRRTRKDGATGVDGRTAADFATDLKVNLQGLAERLRAGTYRPPPVRRALTRHTQR